MAARPVEITEVHRAKANEDADINVTDYLPASSKDIEGAICWRKRERKSPVTEGDGDAPRSEDNREAEVSDNAAAEEEKTAGNDDAPAASGQTVSPMDGVQAEGSSSGGALGVATVSACFQGRVSSSGIRTNPLPRFGSSISLAKIMNK